MVTGWVNKAVQQPQGVTVSPGTSAAVAAAGGGTLPWAEYDEPDLEIALPDGVGGDPGGGLSIQAGSAEGAGAAGQIAMFSGDGEDSNGGDFAFGAGGSINGRGGEFGLQAGNSVNDAGGNLQFTGGNGATDGGHVSFTPGSGTTPGAHRFFNPLTAYRGDDDEIYLDGDTLKMGNIPTVLDVASLDPAAADGVRGFVNDATAPAFGVAVVGGGAVGVPVYCFAGTWYVG